MVIPIYKKPLNIDERKNQKRNMEHAQIIAEKIDLEDKLKIEGLVSQCKKDARGRIQYNRSVAQELLPYFQKYVDPNVKGNIFGCGGCVSKMMNLFFELKKYWLNPTK
jgi:hypothetical protein